VDFDGCGWIRAPSSHFKSSSQVSRARFRVPRSDAFLRVA
jgi:hypothetical protein